MSDAPSLSLPLSLSLSPCVSLSNNQCSQRQQLGQSHFFTIHLTQAKNKKKVKRLKKREINIIENGPQLLALGARAFLFIQTKRENVEETGGKFDDDMNSEEKSTLSVVNLMCERGVPF